MKGSELGLSSNHEIRNAAGIHFSSIHNNNLQEVRNTHQQTIVVTGDPNMELEEGADRSASNLLPIGDGSPMIQQQKSAGRFFESK